MVTGGGTGLGKAIATELAHLGCQVVIASRNQETCQQTAEEINKQVAAIKGGGGKVLAGPSTSIKSEEEITALIKFVIDTCGSLDLLVNNAGGQFVSPAEDISRRGFAAVVETNLIGTFMVCQQAYRQWMQEHGGSIVNITLGNRNGALTWQWGFVHFVLDVYRCPRSHCFR